MGRLLGADRRSLPQQTFPEIPVPAFLGADPFTGMVSNVRTPEQAMSVPTVWQCVSLLANTVSMLPLQTFRKTGSIPSRAPDPLIVTSPSAGMTQSEWLHALMVSLLLRGNGYARIAGRDSMQRPTQLDLIHPDTVQVGVDRETGAMSYRVNGNAVDPATIWHIRGMTMPGMKVGLSPIAFAASSLGLDLSSRQFASDFFANGGIPKAILTSDQKIDQDQATTLKERFLAATRRREPIVLGQGVTYQQIQVRPEESQFLATQQASVAQIARFFSIPPKMIGGSDGSSMTYANVEQLSIDFLTYAVSFWLKRVEDAIFPLLPQPQYVQFDSTALLRTDADTQSKIDVLMVAAKIKTRDEIRAKINMPPLTAEQVQSFDDMPDITVSPTGRPIKASPTTPSQPAVPAVDPQGAPNAQ